MDTPAPLYVVDRSVCIHVPMRDGTHLAVDLYRPRCESPLPGIVVRTPYGRGGYDQGEALAARGYVVLVADARGTGDSEGAYTYYNIADGEYDGYDLVEWLAARSWCDGKVGTTGGSALGIYQVLTGATRPPHLRCMSAAAYPLDFYTDQWRPGGVLRSDNRFGWCQGIAHRSGPAVVDRSDAGDADAIERRERLYVERFRRLEDAVLNRPMGAMHWAGPYFSTPLRTELWDAIDLTPRMRRIDVPVLHAGILYDHFGVGTIRGWRIHDGPKRLMMFPGNLGFAGEQKDFAPFEMDLHWFARWLGGREVEPAPPVMLYCTGVGRWLTFDDWPETRTLPLRPVAASDDGADGLLAGDADETTGGFTLCHDPKRPAVTQGGEDYRDFERQEGVLTFTTPPLAEAVTVVGHPRLRLRLRTELADANVIGRICAVTADGASRQLQFGARKLTLRESLSAPAPLPKGEPFDADVAFWTVCHRFDAGERVRLVLSLSDYPFFENSPHGGELRVDSAALELPVL